MTAGAVIKMIEPNLGTSRYDLECQRKVRPFISEEAEDIFKSRSRWLLTRLRIRTEDIACCTQIVGLLSASPLGRIPVVSRAFTEHIAAAETCSSSRRKSGAWTDLMAQDMRHSLRAGFERFYHMAGTDGRSGAQSRVST